MRSHLSKTFDQNRIVITYGFGTLGSLMLSLYLISNINEYSIPACSDSNILKIVKYKFSLLDGNRTGQPLNIKSIYNVETISKGSETRACAAAISYGGINGSRLSYTIFNSEPGSIAKISVNVSRN